MNRCRRERRLIAAAAVVAAVLVLPGPVASAPAVRDGGIFRIAFQQLSFDYVDPALPTSVEARALLDTTCARLLTYPDKPLPAAIQPVPEVAASYDSPSSIRLLRQTAGRSTPPSRATSRRSSS